MNICNNFKKYTIRDIEKKDLTEVYQMLLCLVKHEKLEGRFNLSEEKMKNAFLQEKRDWFCLVVQDLLDNHLKGFLMYTFSNINRAFHLFPLLHIDHLYIIQSYRNYGVGQKLIQTLKRRAKIKGANKLEVWCMMSNEIGNNFYKKLGAEQINYVNIYRINTS